MKTIYLVRHAQPHSVEHRCLGQTNAPLDEFGLYQAERLRVWFEGKELAAVCTSPLERCVQTARIIADGRMPIDIWPALTEMDTGLWENLSFDEIRKLYPKEYEERGRHLGTTAPPEGESVLEAGARFGACVERLAHEIDGDFVVVGHSGAIRGFLCPLLGVDPDEIFTIRQPYGAVSVLQWEDEKFKVLCVGVKPDSWPDDFAQKQLMDKYDMGEKVIAHCLAVSELASEWAQRLEKADIKVNAELLCAACKLHDISRAADGENHAQKGAELLDKEGYAAVAELILQHHDLGPNAPLEAKLLYLADKMIRETEKVSLAERFESSKEKCKTEQARTAWQRRYDEAAKVETELKNLLALDEL